MTALAIAFDVPFDEAIKAATTRGVVLPDVYYGELQGVARQLAFSIAGIASYDQLQAVRDSLAKATATGQSYGEWKKLASTANLGLPEYRIANIWRTNLQSTYMRGRQEQMLKSVDVMPYWQYDAINDSRVRPSHLAMDGTIRRWDDPWWNGHYPPNGYSCRCSVVPLTESMARRRSGIDSKGEGTGLNKQPRMEDGTEPKPDPGWDYNPFEDRLKPILDAVSNRRSASNASTVMLDALEEAISRSLEMLFAEWVADHGKEKASEMWRRQFGGRPTP